VLLVTLIASASLTRRANGLACVASRSMPPDIASDSPICASSRTRWPALGCSSRFPPDVIGVSVRNIDNSDAIALRTTRPKRATCCSRCVRCAHGEGHRRRRGLRSSARSAVPGSGRRLRRRGRRGEGKRCFGRRSLLRRADRGAARTGARTEGTVVFTPPGEDADLDSLPRPALHRWIDLAATSDTVRPYRSSQSVAACTSASIALTGMWRVGGIARAIRSSSPTRSRS